eukprot:1936693-Prymnesium_polylepis.1
MRRIPRVADAGAGAAGGAQPRRVGVDDKREALATDRALAVCWRTLVRIAARAAHAAAAAAARCGSGRRAPRAKAARGQCADRRPVEVEVEGDLEAAADGQLLLVP